MVPPFGSSATRTRSEFAGFLNIGWVRIRSRFSSGSSLILEEHKWDENSLIARLAGALNADPLRHAKDCVTASPDGARQLLRLRPWEDDLEDDCGRVHFSTKVHRLSV